MTRSMSAGVLSAAGLAVGCGPTFNWREVRAEPTPLTAVPCKPDMATREVPMASRKVELTALSCEAGGATFALMFADIGASARLGELLAQWNIVTLANLPSAGGQATPFRPPALALTQSVQVVAAGQRHGSKVESHAGYFAQGSCVYQAVICAGQLRPEAVDGILSGFRFQ